MYFLRKVIPNKWRNTILDENYLNLGTDGITNCCKTTNNELSIWLTESNDPDSSENLLLISSIAVNSEKPAKFDFIFLESDEISSIGIDLKESDGNTPIDRIKNRHRDMSNLTIEKLGMLSLLIHQKVNSDTQLFSKSNSTIKKIVRESFPKDSIEKVHICNMNPKWENIYD